MQWVLANGRIPTVILTSVECLFNVESLSEVRTLLAGFFSILLEVHPELSIRPILIGAGAQVLLDIRAGEEVTIAGLEG